MAKSSMRPGPEPIDRVGGLPPNDPEWRADAMAQSRHSRFDDVLIEPLEDRDTGRAATICAEVTRSALLDFAPAVVLLAASERRRLQAVAAFCLTLFDFARQSSLEGEKLAQINRWHFDLESTLDGEPPGQPVFVLLAATGDEQPWPEEALDDLVACARHRALHPRPASLIDAEADALRLGSALTRALLPSADETLEHLAAALLRVARLLALGDDLRRHQAGLAIDELPETWAPGASAGEGAVRQAIRAECARLREPLAATRALRSLPRTWRRAATYGVLAARRLVDRLDSEGISTRGAATQRAAEPETRPGLGALERLRLVLRSRWLPL